mmetsp:Transcript_33735/g.54671  ORF Transcript_33735/g.54671 Transcript_33735/m.54671 type:complete len:219 (-) Transcript_33735:1674-2330(-)
MHMDKFTFSVAPPPPRPAPNSTTPFCFSSSVRLSNVSSPLSTCSCSCPNCARIPSRLSPSISFTLCCSESWSASTSSIRTAIPLIASACFPSPSLRSAASASFCCVAACMAIRLAHSLSSIFTLAPYSLSMRLVASNMVSSFVFSSPLASAALSCISPMSFRSSRSARVIWSIAASTRPCMSPLVSPSRAPCSSSRCPRLLASSSCLCMSLCRCSTSA